LNSYPWCDNQKGLWENNFKLVIINTLNSFEDEENIMIGVKEEF
jgi:hypothetical protein